MAVCGKCVRVKYNFDKAFYCCNYEGLIKELIHKFKYNHKKYLIYIFNELMVNFTKNHIDIKSIDTVVPVPLHRGKLQQRGFDQALLLSKKLSKIFGLSLSCNILTRNRDTRQQTHLNKNQRLNNIKGAFSIKPPHQLQFPGVYHNWGECKNKKPFDKKRLLLIDDVFTTAATANECAAILKKAGAESVALLALARGL